LALTGAAAFAQTGRGFRQRRTTSKGSDGSEMDISAKLVKELRDRTGAGMMDCKKALGG
jgi:hypothetical protein